MTADRLVEILYGFAIFQVGILPFQLALWYAQWQENKRTKRLAAACLRALGILTIVKGKSNQL